MPADINAGHGFPALVFVSNELRYKEVIVGFIKYGGILDHHCLHFLFIITVKIMKPVFQIKKNAIKNSIKSRGIITYLALLL